jgi:glycosyltransferase involved in cell wall biosynthesis
MEPVLSTGHEISDTVLLLHFGDNGIRGTETCLIQTVKAFTEKNFKVVVCRNYPVMDTLLNQIYPKPLLVDFQFPEIMIAGKKETSLPIRSYIRAFKQLKGIVKDYHPSLIYCNSGLPCQLGVPIGRLHSVPVLCHFHHPAIKRAYYLWLVVLANKVFFPSQFTKMHSEKKASVSGEVVHNGIDLDRFQPINNRDPQLRSKLGIADNAIVIGQVAQLVPHKRPDFLIRSFSFLLKQCNQPIHLCLVGKGPMEALLRDLVSSLGIEEHVSITGYVGDVLPYYQEVFDINVLVSTTEGLGLSVIEGSACGLPVIVTKCTGLIETVVENETGFTFEVDDINGLCGKLLRLINNPALRSSLGASGRGFIEQQFSSEAYNAGIIEIVEDMLGRYS